MTTTQRDLSGSSSPEGGSRRDLFAIPDDIAYLNCAYMGPQLRSVTAAGQEAVARKGQPWTIGAADFFSGPEALRAAFADLAGVDADGVALVPSASYGIGTAGANLRVEAGERIVVLAEQFPANVYPWRALARQRGAEVVTIARPADEDWTSAVLAVLGGSGGARGPGTSAGRVAIAALPHCHWTDGGLVDLAAVRTACDASGTALVIDASQSLGAFPLDVASVRPDALVAVGYKWLLGPYSLGYAWYAEHLRDGVPLEETWFARAGSEDFAGLVDYVEDYQPGARRFDMGEVANFALVPMALAALEQISTWGVAAIAERLRERTDAIVEGAAGLGFTAAPRELRGPHFVGLRLPQGTDPRAVAAALAARAVHVSVRGRAVRVSPHLHTSDRDVAALLEGLAAAQR